MNPSHTALCLIHCVFHTMKAFTLCVLKWFGNLCCKTYLFIWVFLKIWFVLKNWWIFCTWTTECMSSQTCVFPPPAPLYSDWMGYCHPPVSAFMGVLKGGLLQQRLFLLYFALLRIWMLLINTSHVVCIRLNISSNIVIHLVCGQHILWRWVRCDRAELPFFH